MTRDTFWSEAVRVEEVGGWEASDAKGIVLKGLRELS